MDSNNVPPTSGSPGQPTEPARPQGSGYPPPPSGSDAPPASGDGSNLWTPPAYPAENTPARVEQPAYTPPPQQPPPPTYQPQGAPTQPVAPPQQAYAPPPQQQGYPPQQAPYQQQSYAPPPQGYPPAGYPPQQGYAQPPVAQPVKKSGVPVAVWVIGGIFVFLVVCSAVAYFTVLSAVNSVGTVAKDIGNTAGASITAAQFDIALSTGNYEEAYSYLGGNLASRYSGDILQQKWEALAGTGSVSTHFGDPKTSGSQTKMNWVVTPPGGKSTTIELTMDEAGKDWKIIDAKPDLIPNP